jgi:hypothetical protein
MIRDVVNEMARPAGKTLAVAYRRQSPPPRENVA